MPFIADQYREIAASLKPDKVQHSAPSYRPILLMRTINFPRGGFWVGGPATERLRQVAAEAVTLKPDGIRVDGYALSDEESPSGTDAAGIAKYRANAVCAALSNMISVPVHASEVLLNHHILDADHVLPDYGCCAEIYLERAP